MRITVDQAKTIKQGVIQYFGETSKVYLFGSRVDDSKKGGDIDLFIDAADKNDLLDKKIKFLAKLKMLLGEQKIDVVLAKDGNTTIEKNARRNGILL